MLPVSLFTRAMIIAAMAVAASTPALQAGTPQDKFYHAYYLQTASGDYAAAAKLYGAVASAKGIPAEMRAEAKARLAACREELASADFARLMPPEPLAYIEMNRPGERLRKFIDELGLLADADGPRAADENRLAISPAVIDAVLGMRGMAAAVTGFDPVSQTPSGVVVFHPGNMELVRGLIEMALPVASESVSPIGGYPTYKVEDQVLVTLTSRLVIASTQESEIEGVIYRLKSPDEDSLATNERLAELLQERDEALLFFCVNIEPIMPLVNMALAGGATQNRELALAHALLDIQSFRSLSGRLDLSDQGLLFELTLRLDEGHRNLVYNFLRRPAIDPESLRCIPPGAAGFVAMALNEAPPSYHTELASEADERPIVTALDIGREIFANINGVAVYVLPPAGARKPSGIPIPDVAAAITVNDPAKSQALWSQILGIASLATGAATMEGRPQEIAGVSVRSYRFDQGVTVYLAIQGHDLLIGSTSEAIARSIEAKRNGESILDDDAFSKAAARIGPHTTIAACAHPGRCAEIAKSFMSPGEIAEMEPVVGLLTETVAALTVDHSDQMLRVSAAVTGVPDVGEFVGKMIAQERRRGKRHGQLAAAVSRENWKEAVEQLDGLVADDPDDTKLLRSKFDVLAVHKEDHTAALAWANEMFARLHDDAQALNNFAWALLTEDKYEQQYNEAALRFARRSNDITEHSVWAYLDTLALAEFVNGDAEKAIKLEKEAIKLCRRSSAGQVPELENMLKRFQGGVDDQ